MDTRVLRKLVIGAAPKDLYIDMDGTSVYDAFPKIGDVIPENIEMLKELKRRGYRLIIYTASLGSPGHSAEEIVAHFNSVGLQVDGVTNKKSPRAVAFVDDRAVNVPYNAPWPADTIDKIEEIANRKKIK